MESMPIRRYVNADNSCLFSTIAYLIDTNNFNENSGLIYRLMAVDYIKDGNISQDILGVSKDEYITKIADRKSWGGAIELKLFSDIFQVQIASLDVMTGRMDLFGETEQYEKRILSPYDGVIDGWVELRLMLMSHSNQPRKMMRLSCCLSTTRRSSMIGHLKHFQNFRRLIMPPASGLPKEVTLVQASR